MAVVYGTNNPETIDAADGVTNGNDTILGLDGNDYIYGLNGDDYLKGGGGADRLYGGSGTDTAFYDDSPEGIFIDLYLGKAAGGTAQGDVLSSIENVWGSNYDDFIYGTFGANVLTGGSGNDYLVGAWGSDTLDGGDGIDTIAFWNDDGDLTVNLATGVALTAVGTDTLIGIENVEGAENDDTITGNGSANALSGSGGSDELHGAGGNDVLSGGASGDILDGGSGVDKADYSGSDYAVTVNLQTGTAYGGDAAGDSFTSIEGIIGSYFSDTLTGRDSGADEIYGGNGYDSIKGGGGADILYGDAGNDTLIGGTGFDTMYGGWGDDFFGVDSAGDVVVEYDGQGTDTVSASVSYTLAAGQSIEILKTSAPSGTAAINLTGNEIANTITGNAGTNTLNGGGGGDTLDGGAGADTMFGGLGDDTYVVDNAGDAVTENAGQGTGTDTVLASINYTLTANVENLTLTGMAAINGTGNILGNSINGNSAANILDGGGGEDTLFGGGDGDTLYGNSAGDQLYGSTGDDVYYLSGAATGVFENLNEGIDSVYVGANHTLGSNVENLVLTGGNNLFGTGNILDNQISSNGANCTLSGGDGSDTLFGGAGVDSMYGGIGNDTYYAHNSSAGALENAGEGIDKVYADVNFTLGSNVENLFLTGVNNLFGTGNILDNQIFSNNANCTLFGGDGNDTLNGGTGVDSMYGGIGDDRYYVHNSSAAALENAGEGTDWVYTSVSYALGSNVENLKVIGAFDINATGNSSDNRFEDSFGDNSFTGNGGADSFVFAFAGTGHDTIADFDAANGNAGHDLIDLTGRGLNFAALTINQVGADTQILIGADEITLANVLKANVDAGDFLF